MKKACVFLFALSACCIAGVVSADNKKMDFGKRDYVNSCAVCHGIDGRAQTQVMDILKVAPPDLRQLSKKNGGVFPMSRVYETIDGRLAIKGHGSRDMPIWGQRFSVEAAPVYDDFPANTEIAARARILGLIDYLYRIQDR